MYRIDIVILANLGFNYLASWGEVIVYVLSIDNDLTSALFFFIFTLPI